jgi:acetyltransferase-like isoleucine patch superfamily enzyme
LLRWQRRPVGANRKTDPRVRPKILSRRNIPFRPRKIIPSFQLGFEFSSTVHLPMRVGDHVIFEEGAVVRALSIGSNTYIGKNAVIVR